MVSFIIFWGIIILLFIALIIGLIFLAYWLPKRLGVIKLGLWLSGILASVILVSFLATVFEDKLFFKTDVQEILNEHRFELKENFEIISNKSGGVMDYSHQFRITISQRDRERLIEQIKSANNYKKETVEMFDLREGKIRYSDKDTLFIANYHDIWNYIYEYYKPNSQGHKPTWDKIMISKTGSELIYERVLD